MDFNTAPGQFLQKLFEVPEMYFVFLFTVSREIKFLFFFWLGMEESTETPFFMT